MSEDKERKNCYQCPMRHKNCHSECPTYEGIKARNAVINDKRRQDKVMVNYKLTVFKTYRKNRNLDGE